MYAQSPDRTISFQQKQSLEQAIRLVNSNKNDTALVALQSILNQLKTAGAMDLPFGLQVQLAKAQALEQDHQHGDAMTLLNKIMTESEAAQYWEIYAQTCLAEARLHEKMHRGEAAKKNLELARSTIERYQLDSLESPLAIRQAFWHQRFGYPDSVLFYSEKALKSTIEIDDPILKYSFLMLKGWRLHEEDYQSAITFYQQAAELAKSMEDYTRLSATWGTISRAYLRNYDHQNALLYNDSTITACYQAIAAGHNRIFSLSDAYEDRAKILREEGQLDSVLFYMKRGYAQKIKFIEQQQFEKVAEIDAQYNDEKRLLEIEQLADEVQQEKRSRNLTIAIALLTLFFGSILTYYYFQLRRAKQKTEEQAERLRNLDAAKSRFFANVSHELRTPLSLILGPIKTLLNEKKLTGKQTSLLRMALQGSKNLKLLVDEILDLGKMETGKMELHQSAVPVASFFKFYFAQFESLAEQKRVTYSFACLVENDTAALLDEEKCRQIFYNLLSNAFKFTPPGGSVSAILKLENNELYLAVQDAGEGIHPKDLPHVFDRYFQTNRPDAPASGGTGIGLALCHEYAKLFGGNISVESTLGKGTVFKVKFPVELVESHSPEEDLGNEMNLATEEIEEKDELFVSPVATSASVVSEAKRPTVLVVEDNAELQQYLQLVLNDHYQVVVAENGQAALHHIKTAIRPDLIISDLMMPVMDGFQLLEKLKGEPATQQIPVIMLTARAEKDDRLKALRIGVDDYLTKPFDEEELLVRIDNLLANQSMRKEAAIEEEKTIGTVPEGLSEEDKKWLDSFEDYLLQHLSNNHLSVLMLADEFAMSMSTLLRQLKRLTGLTPQKYLTEMRLDKARELLAERRFSSVSRVAREVGYGDLRNFSKNFKTRFGKIPSDFLNN